MTEMNRCRACGHISTHIKNMRELLQQIAAGVNKFHDKPTAVLEVQLLDEGEVVLTCGVVTVLDYLANDIYWNEEGDWSNASIAEVRAL